MQKSADGEGVGLETEWISVDIWLRSTRLSVCKRHGFKIKQKNIREMLRQVQND